jgi:hypothetical protein
MVRRDYSLGQTTLRSWDRFCAIQGLGELFRIHNLKARGQTPKRLRGSRHFVAKLQHPRLPCNQIFGPSVDCEIEDVVVARVYRPGEYNWRVKHRGHRRSFTDECVHDLRGERGKFLAHFPASKHIAHFSE